VCRQGPAAARGFCGVVSQWPSLLSKGTLGPDHGMFGWRAVVTQDVETPKPNPQHLLNFGNPRYIWLQAAMI